LKYARAVYESPNGKRPFRFVSGQQLSEQSDPEKNEEEAEKIFALQRIWT